MAKDCGVDADYVIMFGEARVAEYEAILGRAGRTAN